MQWTKHPILEVPSRREQLALGPDRLLEYHTRREAAIERERDDPYRYGDIEIECKGTCDSLRQQTMYIPDLPNRANPPQSPLH